VNSQNIPPNHTQPPPMLIRVILKGYKNDNASKQSSNEPPSSMIMPNIKSVPNIFLIT